MSFAAALAAAAEAVEPVTAIAPAANDKIDMQATHRCRLPVNLRLRCTEASMACWTRHRGAIGETARWSLGSRFVEPMRQALQDGCSAGRLRCEPTVKQGHGGNCD